MFVCVCFFCVFLCKSTFILFGVKLLSDIKQLLLCAAQLRRRAAFRASCNVVHIKLFSPSEKVHTGKRLGMRMGQTNAGDQGLCPV